MLPKQTSFVSLLLAVAVAGILGSSAYKGHIAMRDKAQVQAQAVSDFKKWKAEYTKLLPVDEHWKSSLQSMSEARDLLSIYGLLGKEPNTNPDNLLVEKIEVLQHQNMALHATRVCLTGTSGGGVTFDAPNFTDLMKGLQTLAKRPDLQMGAVRIFENKGRANATVSGLCLLLRDIEGGKK